MTKTLRRYSFLQRISHSFTAEAMECLQVASEAMIIQLFEDSVLVMVNAKRKTLMVRDMEIVKRIRGGF